MKSVLVFLFIVMLVGCAPGPNAIAADAACIDPAGFWLGLWHGTISLITFIVSLFNDNVRIYEVCNSGVGYDFGFLIGISSSSGSAISTSSHRKSK
jgi:hypothetical protein